MIEAGMPGFIASPWLGMVFPRGTPPEIVNRMNSEIRKALDDPNLQKSLRSIGASVHTTSPDEFARLLQTEYTKWGRIVRDSGARVD